MVHTFNIVPDTYTRFEDEAELIEECKGWGLLSDKANKSKSFTYKGNGMNLTCTIAGYVDSYTAVIQFEDGQLHCVHPSYLKEMQASSYSQKSTATAASSDPEGIGSITTAEELPSSEAAVEISQAAVTEDEPAPPAEPAAAALPPIEDISEEPKPKAKEKTSKRAPKLALPEEKVKMTATVQEFTSVPNNFSDNEDEVIIYEAVSIIDPATEVGLAWSSHSATLKKLELEVGDTLTFECKIVAKKLTKHPVPYKINNPAKIQKVQA
ncbi:hypothetical protein [Paenibacillus harenae]|uniref:hypothetical protein n=1 Tax=Paenibacillus harenae TaxID=306543 RepID=UPI002793925C|nr:hypothetical protein [Paenibacillus harenae]MDQ0062246.1 hypothetical protein [Paenibacillus harenae]